MTEIPPPETTTIQPSEAPATTEAVPQGYELTEPKEKSKTFRTLRETLKKRLERISSRQPQEQASVEQSQDQQETQPNERLKKNTQTLSNILEVFTQNPPNLTQLNGEIITVTINDDEGKSSRTLTVKVYNGEFVNLDDSSLSEEDRKALYITVKDAQGIEKKIPNIPKIVESMVPHVFPDLTPEQQQAIVQAILNQEGQPAQLEQLGEFLGYVSCRQIEAILGIREDQKQELISKFKGKKLDEFKEPLERAQAQYFALTQPKEGQEKTDVSVVFTEAQPVIEILEQLNPKVKSKAFEEIIKPILEQQNQAKKESQTVEEFAEKYGLKELLNKSLSDIVTTHYTDIQNGNKPEKFTEETFAKLTELLMQNKVISDAHRERLISKFETGGKFVGILAIIMALLLWKSSQEGSQGGGGMR